MGKKSAFTYKLWLVITSAFITSCMFAANNIQPTTAVSQASTTLLPSTVTPVSSITSTLSSSLMQEGNPGSIIAFVSDRREKNNLDIWFMDIETGLVEPLTSDAAQDWHPLWSPNGEKLAYLSAKNQEDVYIVVVDFETRVVLKQVYKPDIWSFSWSSNNELWLDTFYDIWRYNLLDDDLIGPLFITGGSIDEHVNAGYLALGVQESNEVYIYDLQIQVTKGMTLPISFANDTLNLSVSDLAWANTAPELAVTFQTTTRFDTGRISLFSLSEQGFSEVAMETSEELSLNYCRPAWSFSDEYISYVVAWSYSEVPCLGNVFVARDHLSKVFHISAIATITKQPWSPDNDQIVYAKNAKSPWWATSRSFGFPGEGSIWVSNYDGSEQKLLTDGDWYDGEAVWRP